MKPREPRRKVMIQARMRVGAAWRDACILDLSSRGMMIHSNEPLPEKGYLELRRGRHVIVARVVWSRDRRHGLRTQDEVPTEAIISEPDRSAGPLTAPGIERRDGAGERARRASAHEHARWRGRAWEFASLTLVGVSLATLAYGAVASMLDQPLAAVETALAGR